MASKSVPSYSAFTNTLSYSNTTSYTDVFPQVERKECGSQAKQFLSSLCMSGKTSVSAEEAAMGLYTQDIFCKFPSNDL